MITVLSALADSRADDVLRRSMRAVAQGFRCEVVTVESIGAVDPAMRRSLAAAIISPKACGRPDPRNPRSIPADLVRFFSSNPRLPVAIWADAEWFHPERTLELKKAGMWEVIVSGDEDIEGRVTRVLSVLLSSRRAEAFLGALPDWVPPGMRAVVLALVNSLTSPITPDRIAAGAFGSRRTLFRAFKRSRLPPPRVFVGWIRVYLVLWMVEEGKSFASAAARVGHTAKGFQQMAGRRLGKTRQADLRAIGWRGVVKALRQHIERHRATTEWTSSAKTVRKSRGGRPPGESQPEAGHEDT